MTHGHEHPADIFITGDKREERPMRVIDDEGVISDSYSGGVCVEEGASFIIGPSGHQSGSLTFQPGSKGTIKGRLSGSLTVRPGAEVTVEGQLSGSVHVSSGAKVTVSASGRLSGSLRVEGTIENSGKRAGTEHVDGGQIRDIDGGSVVQPIFRNGIRYYDS